MRNTVAATSTRVQLDDTDEAVLAFAVTSREPDRDVHRDDHAWWLAQEERLEIRSELAAHGLLWPAAHARPRTGRHRRPARPPRHGLTRPAAPAQHPTPWR